MTDNDTKPKKGESAAQFKERIEEKQREFARAQAMQPAQVPPTAPNPAVPAAAPAAQVPPAPAPSVSPESTPKFTPVSGNPEVDEWWQKKGFKTTDDVAQSYREMERELNRKNQERAAAAAAAPAPAAQPPAPVAYPPFYPIPGFVPPAPAAPAQPMPSVAPADVERLARNYGFEPQDFERVAAVSNDLARSAIQQELNRVLPGIINQVRSVDQKIARNDEMVGLMSDPAFKNPQVQFEMHRVLEADPTIYSRTATPHRYAFEQALMRVARANLGGSKAAGNAPEPTPAAAPQSRPPTMAGGNGGGGGGAPSSLRPEQVDNQAFANMPLDQKREHLRAIGALGR